MTRILTLVFFSLILFSCGSKSTSQEEDMPIEQKLAMLDTKTLVEPTDTRVLRIKALLDYLSQMYHEPIDSIANETYKATAYIQSKGIDETNLNILEEMNKVGTVENTPYKDALTLYVIMRAKGY